MKYLIGLFAGKFTEGYQGGPTSLSDKAAIFCGKKRPILSFARLGQMSQWSGVEIYDEDEGDDNFGDDNFGDDNGDNDYNQQIITWMIRINPPCWSCY